MKVLFMGTPEFAVPCLRILIDNNYEIVGVVTQPDRPKGRGNKLVAPPVKELAMLNNLNVFQPEKVKEAEAVRIIKEMNPDIIIVVAFGQILSKELLEIPKYGCINVHASLLPAYRGAAPINWCIINGEKITGVTTMYMNEGLDTGDMILKDEMAIFNEENAEDLYNRLSLAGAQLLLKTIKEVETGTAIRTPQDDLKASYAPIIRKNLGKIDWNKSAESIVNLIRGTYPWPGAYSSYKGRSFKIISAQAIFDVTNKNPGRIIKADKDGMLVNCGKNSLLIKEIQFENEKRMTVDSYLRGHSIENSVELE